MVVTVENGIYSKIAALFEYPWDDIGGAAEECVKALQAHTEYPEDAVEELKKFKVEIDKLPLDDVQGIFSYTFEMSSGEYTLDLGYHLLDGFKRANNLLSLKQMYRNHDFPFESLSKGELPDNLPLVLRFFDFAKDDEVVSDLRETFLIKALEKLSKNFEKKHDSPYGHLIRAILIIVDTDVKGAKQGEGQGA